MNSSPYILVVEDEERIRDAVAHALEGEGLAVVQAANAADAAALIEAGTPELVVLDLGLPDQDGVDFIRDLRSRLSIPILVVSGRAWEGAKVDALDTGADDYLTKPFGMAEFLARVRALLRRRQSDRGDPNAIIRFGDFAIDRARRIVERQGEPLHLTKIEYRLLVFLATNPGKVFTHRQLLFQVWGDQATQQHQYLRVYVGHLRQKIEKEPAFPRHILTEIGVGYRFQP